MSDGDIGPGNLTVEQMHIIVKQQAEYLRTQTLRIVELEAQLAATKAAHEKDRSLLSWMIDDTQFSREDIEAERERLSNPAPIVCKRCGLEILTWRHRYGFGTVCPSCADAIDAAATADHT